MKLFSIEKMCKVLQVSSGSYYRWKKQKITVRLQLKINIKVKIISIHFESKQRYGNPRITLELDSLDWKPSKAWVTDITYIQTKEGFIYLTTIMDLYDGKL